MTIWQHTDGVTLPGAGALLMQGDEAYRSGGFDSDQHRQVRGLADELQQRRFDSEPIRQGPQDTLADPRLVARVGVLDGDHGIGGPGVSQARAPASARPPAGPRRAWPAPSWRRT